MTIKISQPRCRQITNGDVIKAAFPNVNWRYDSEHDVFTSHIDGTHRQYFDASWWDAPYKSGNTVCDPSSGRGTTNSTNDNI